MTLRKLSYSLLSCCFAFLIVFSGIPECLVEAAGGTVSPLSDETVLATFGQSFEGWYHAGSYNDWSTVSTTFQYYATLDFTSVHTTSATLTYYKNLGCKIFLYRADVTGLSTNLGANGQEGNIGVNINVGMSGVTELHFLCGLQLSRDGSNFGARAPSRTNYNLAGSDMSTDANRNGSYELANMWLYTDPANQTSTSAAYFTMQDTVYTGSASDIMLNSSISSLRPSLFDDKYAFFYIVSPVANDDVVISGGGGTNVDIDVIVGDIKDIMSSNNGILSQLYDFVVTIPETILDGLKALFIPSEEDLEGFKDDADDLLHETFGGLYDAEDLVHDGLSDIPSNSKSTITFPGITVSQFSLPAQEVPIRPAGFDVLFDTLATVIDIIATFAFLNMLKHKLSKILGGGEDE